MKFEKLCSTEILETVTTANLFFAAGTTMETKINGEWKNDGKDAGLSASAEA